MNCVDRRVRTARCNKAALIWEGEPGDRRTLTYWDIYQDVNRFANALRDLGVEKGDRVAVYLPMTPELPITLLACARIGAVHSVVFAGFSAGSLRNRINDMQAKVMVTGNGGYRRGGVIPLKQITDDALDGAPSVESVVVMKREGLDADIAMRDGRDHWYHDLMAKAAPRCDPEPMGSEDLRFTLYTSGTAGKPKGIGHATGGYLVGTYATSKWSLRPEGRGRLRAAVQRGHLRHVRGRPRHSAPGPVLEMVERYGPMEVDRALVDHPDVVEATVVGKPHEIKGQGIAAFVTLKEGVTPHDGTIRRR